MERCRLCGGRLSGGKCRECGLDNRKNDSKYRLNVHNDKGNPLHQGECWENLNADRWERKKKQKPSAHPNVERKKKEQKPGAYSNAEGKKKEQSPGAHPNAERKETEARRKERQSVGTVKKKRRAWLWLVLLLVLVINLLPLGIEYLEDHEELTEEFLQNLLGEGEFYSGGEVFQEQVTERPQRIDWDQTEEGYWKRELTQGCYTVGYEIPQGEYQFICETGTAWIDLLEGDQVVDYYCLYSQEEQPRYEESVGEACPYFERSEPVSLKNGITVYLEDCEESIYIEGIGDIASLKEHEAQGLTETVAMRADPAALEGEQVAEKDFPTGVYDLMLENGKGWASVLVENEKTEKYRYISLTGEEVFFRFPFERGDQVKISYQEEGTCVLLAPSY